MKKFLCFLLILNTLIISDCLGNQEYNQTNSMSFDDFLSINKSKKDWKALKLNESGDVTFKDKIILTRDGIPLNDNTAYTTIELKILFAAQGIKPRKWCNPKNTAKNGTLGCYIDNPDK